MDNMTGIKIPLGLLLASGLSVFGQAATIGDLSTVVQGGAVAVLAWVAYMLFGELKDNRKERTDNTDKLTAAFTQLREHCITMNANGKENHAKP